MTYDIIVFFLIQFSWFLFSLYQTELSKDKDSMSFIHNYILHN